MDRSFARLSVWGIASLLLAISAGPAAAWHFAGKVKCDVDNSGTFTSADTPLAGLTVRVTALIVGAGTTYHDDTDGAGAYFISLPDFPNAYDAEIINLPGGYTVVYPAAGEWQNVQLTSTIVSRDDIDFLVQGCGPTTTTSSTTSTSTSVTSTTQPGGSTTTTSATSSTATSTTATSTTATSTTATSSTTPTTLPVCDCAGFPFLIRRDAKFNNKADFFNSVAVNDAEGRIRLSRLVYMADGTIVAGNDVTIGNFSDVYDVQANVLHEGRDIDIRGTIGLPTLPIVDPFCPLEEFSCGTEDLVVDASTTITGITPGSYGRLKMLNGAVLNLPAGTYDFCSLQMGRRAVIRANGPVTINVVGNIRIGNAALIIATPGDGPVLLRTLGTSFRLSADALASIALVAPNAKAAFSRRSLIDGCFCVDRAKTDKGTNFLCEPPAE